MKNQIKPNQARRCAPPPVLEPVFALPYDDLQQIHTLAGMVCGWNMSLPTKMINQAQEVSRRMMELKRIDLTQRKRLQEAKAFVKRFKAMMAEAQNK